MTQPQEKLPVVVEDPKAPIGALSLVRPIAKPTDLLALHDDVTEIIQKALKQGIDYDVIPGTGDKPSLLKPGAEKLNVAFGAYPVYQIVEQQVEHDREVRWSKKKKKWNNAFRGDRSFTFETEDGTSLGLYRYVIKCSLMRDGRTLGECVGVCSTLESKYIDRPRDCENTALKMAQKRAYVGATLHAYALSNRFTQDVEDIGHGDEQKPAPKKGYDGKPDHQKILHETLKAKNIDEAFWEEIHNDMMGKGFADLEGVIKNALDRK